MNASHEEERSHLGPLVRAAVVLLLLLLVTAGVQSWRDLAEARELKSSLEGQIGDTEESIALLQNRLRRIDNDPAILEQLAREELGWVREGDIVVVLPRSVQEADDGTVSVAPTPEVPAPEGSVPDGTVATSGEADTPSAEPRP